MELHLFSRGDVKSIGRIYEAILASRDGVDAVGRGGRVGRHGGGRTIRIPAIRSRSGSGSRTVGILSSHRSGCGAEEKAVF